MANPAPAPDTNETPKRGPGRPPGPAAVKAPKADLMKAFQADYSKVAAAEAVLADLRAAASTSAGAVTDAYGKGPHKLGADKIVTFQRVNGETRFDVLSLAGID